MNLPRPVKWFPSILTAIALVRFVSRSEEHTSELQSLTNLVCRLLLEKKKNKRTCNRSRPITYHACSPAVAVGSCQRCTFSQDYTVIHIHARSQLRDAESGFTSSMNTR